MSFIDDIQGKNTQLYPIITIEAPSDTSGDDVSGGWVTGLEEAIYISTNNTSLYHIQSEKYIQLGEVSTGERIVGSPIYFKPLLLNIPSIKESIDVESRKFKISNVSLDISNVEYNGKRFTDILTDTSLINWKVSIQFVSPTGNKFSTIRGLSEHNGKSLYDLWTNEDSPPPLYTIQESRDKMTQMVYQGIIRRISHDDTKVKVELEDLTEKKAHKDLPQIDAPASEYLPAKYSNKPVPMVYGHVDRSPLLPYYSYSEDLTDDDDDTESILEYRLKIDSNDIDGVVTEDVTIGNSPFTKSALFINENDAYFNIHKTNAALGSDTGIDNFRYGNTSIVLDTDMSDYTIESEELLENDTVKGRLRIHQIRRFNKIEWQPQEGNTTNGGTLQGELSVSTPTQLGHITGTIDLNLYRNAGFESWMTRDWNAGHYKCILEPLSIPNSLAKDADGDLEDVITRVLVDVVHFNFSHGFGIPEGGTANSHHESFPDTSLGGTRGKYTSWAVWLGSPAFYCYTGAAGSGLESNNFVARGSRNNISGVHDIDEILLTDFNAPTKYDSINIGIPQHLHQAIDGTNETFTSDAYDSVFSVDTEIKDAFVVQTILLDGISDKDYYANVNGRVNTFDDHVVVFGLHDEEFIQNPIDIIYDLVRKELGHDAIDETEYAEAKAAHDGWKFGFTVNKKINSKKLIEDIAKSTKCFPKFKNDGTFGFNTIKDTYTVSDILGNGDYETATEIKQSEVISYSFKKTKPEQIYKKVTVSYNKDYAQDSYLKTANVIDEGHDDYYGIEKSSDAHLEFESDYIRHDNTEGAEQTADKLASFLSKQYKNNHLIFNLKLPFQYIDLEIGGLVKFRELFDGAKAYGIDYRKMQAPNIYAFGDYQWYFPLFVITSTKKNLDSVEIECMQLHSLKNNADFNFGSNPEWWDGLHNNDTEGTFYFPDSEPIVIPEGTATEVVITPPTITLSNGDSITGSISINTEAEGTAINLDSIKAIDGDQDSTDISNDIIVTTDLGQSFSGGGSHYLGDFGVQYSEPEQILVTYRVISPTSGMESYINQIIHINLTETPPSLTISIKDSYSENFSAGMGGGEAEFMHHVPLEGNNGINYFEKYVYNTSDDAEIDYYATDPNEGDLTDSVEFATAADGTQFDVFGAAQAYFNTSSATEKIFQIMARVTDSTGLYSIKQWQIAVTDVPIPAILGDVNSDGALNILDVVQGIGIILGNTQPTEQQSNALDYNQDGNVDVIDIVWLISDILEQGGNQ